ncbi:Bifunctional protein FolD [Triticum urartu]|uniref:Bifunctional protein FolD n=1 Tax=Triticum urartu TaxID=4572 RepID=M8A864_TRIUA|nr:Bifunctional protein FolD [Triticum urartu]
MGHPTWDMIGGGKLMADFFVILCCGQWFRILLDPLPQGNKSQKSKHHPVLRLPCTCILLRTPNQRLLQVLIKGTIIDGKSIAEDIKLQIAEEFRRMKKEVAHVPGLAIVLVGDRGDSQSHVRFIVKGCEEVGIKSLLSELPQNCTKDEVVDSTSRLNGDPSVHGILLRLPLPQAENCVDDLFE